MWNLRIMRSLPPLSWPESIEETLGLVAEYPIPVARSGNNGSYNWGWLALARNTRLMLFDHTTYGTDRSASRGR